jgi:hypothetical protein
MKSMTVRMLQRVFIGGAVLLSGLVNVPISPVSAATLVVTTLDDVVDANDSLLSFREAMGLALNGDTITFAASLFVNGPQTMRMNNFISVPRAGITVEGPGRDVLTIEGTARDHNIVGYEASGGVMTVTLSTAPVFAAQTTNFTGQIFVYDTNVPFAGIRAVTGVSGNTFTMAWPNEIAYTTASGKVFGSATDPSVHWGDSGRFMTVSQSFRITDVTIQNFHSERGGAFHVRSGGALTLERSRVQKNGGINWYTCGGAIRSDRSTVTIRNSILRDNLGKCNGALLFGDGDTTILTITDSTFENNIAASGWDVIAYHPTIISGSSFSGAKTFTGTPLGSFFIGGTAGSVSISNSSFRGAGGFLLANASTATVSGSTFVSTTSDPALSLSGTYVSLTGNTAATCTTAVNTGIHTSSGNNFAGSSTCATVNSTTGARVANYSRTSNVVTMTTDTDHGFRVGDLVRLCGFQDFQSGGTCGFVATVASIPTTVSFTFNQTAANLSLKAPVAHSFRSSMAFTQTAVGPGAPVITGVTPGSGQVVLTWTAPSSGSSIINDYIIEFSKNSGAWTIVNDAVSTATNSTITGLDSGASYRFRVAAVSSVTTGAYSNISSAVIPNGSTTTTSPPVTTSPTVTTIPNSSTPVVTSPSSGSTTDTSGGNTPATEGVIDTLLTERGNDAVVQQSPTLVTTTTDVINSSTTSSTTIPAPVAPTAQPGSASALVNGEEVETTVTRMNNALLVDVGGINATIWGLAATGERINLDDSGNLRLNSSDSIVIEAGGFEPAQDIEVWMFSTPSQLGVLTAGIDGKISGTFPLPNNVPAGDHRIVLEGPNSLGQNVTLGVGLFVGEPMGDGVSPWVIWIPVTLAVSLGLIIPTTLRRRRQASTSA